MFDSTYVCVVLQWHDHCALSLTQWVRALHTARAGDTTIIVAFHSQQRGAVDRAANAVDAIIAPLGKYRFEVCFAYVVINYHCL